MTLTYGFYDSVSSDRLYNAKQFGSIFDGIIADGVVENYGNALVVHANSPESMHVVVYDGRAWFDHTWTFNDANITLAIAAADPTYNRIDTVYLEVNESAGVRANSIAVATGTPSATPVPPTLTQTSTVHQYPLADVLVVSGATVIWEVRITDRRGTVDCPWALGIITNAVQGHDHTTTYPQIPTAGIENDAITAAKVGDRVPQFYRRKGGSATDWNSPGNTNYTPGAVRMQAGATTSSGTSSSKSVTFPVAFSYDPIVILTVSKLAYTAAMLTVYFTTPTSFEFYAFDDAGNPVSVDVFWLAIGPE